MTKMPADDPRLFCITAQRLRIDIAREQLVCYVASAFKAGASWRQIGQALGTSPQAAWTTYKPLVTGAGIPEDQVYSVLNLPPESSV